MNPLDDRSGIEKLDPKGMFPLTDRFPDQCREALRLAQEVELPLLQQPPRVVVLSGMGGSAAGGDFVRAMFEEQAGVPFLVNRDYTLPHYVGLGDLVLCASYSGQTEETLASYELAKSVGARIIAITSGGRLAELARADGFPVIQIPGGQPPRTALGYLFIPALCVCERLKLLPTPDYETAFRLLETCTAAWTVDVPASSNPTKQLAEKLQGTLPILYGIGHYQGASAYRWKAQINENAKMMAFWHTFPELNHNEILGWVGATKQNVARWSLVMLGDEMVSAKMAKRAEVTERLVEGKAETYHVPAIGDDLLSKMLTLTYYGDFVSLYLSVLNGVDPENIDSINLLKSELSKVS